MPSEDDGVLAARVSMGQVSVPLVLVEVSRVSVPAVRGGQVQGVGWAEGVFGQQLVVKIQICTMSVDEQRKYHHMVNLLSAIYLPMPCKDPFFVP